MLYNISLTSSFVWVAERVHEQRRHLCVRLATIFPPHAVDPTLAITSPSPFLLQVLGEGLLRSMGTEALAAVGMPYLRIRSLAVPFVLVCMVAQGACLGQQDSRTPMAIFMVRRRPPFVLGISRRLG